LFICFVTLGLAQVGPNVTVKRNRLFYGDTEFFIKGICYSPVPLGMLDMDKETLVNGTGLCSHKETPYFDGFSACFDS
jgi:hypothetical protein